MSLDRSRSKSASSYRPWALPALSLLLAVWGQWAILTERLVLDGVVLYSAAAALLLLFVVRGQRLVKAPTPPAPDTPAGGLFWPASLKLALLAASCALLTWTFSEGNRFRPTTVLFWILACVLYLRAFWANGKSDHKPVVQRIRSLARGEIALSRTTVGLVLVVLLGAFFRFYQINSVPAEMTSDHAEKLLDIRDVLKGEFHIFFPRNTGREPLEFFMAIPLVKSLGLGHLALKLLTATVSLMTVPVVYFIGKELAGARYGLLAAFILAVSKWDVAIGRVGLRFPYYPLFAALAFLFLLRALRTGRRNDYLVCGLATGIGLYGYSPFRAMIPLILAAVLAKCVFDRRQGWEHLRRTAANASLCLGAVVVITIPLARYMVDNPGMFWLRALSRVSGPDAALSPNPQAVLLSNIANALLMFNWRGDVVWVNTVPGDPVLDYVSGALFLLGMVWCLFALIRDHEPAAAYLLLALGILILPSILSISFPAENPSVVRAGGATFVVALLAAAPLYLSTRRMLELSPGLIARWLSSALLVVVLALMVRVNFDRYFVDYASQYRQSARNSSEIAALIGGFARSVGSPQNAYVKSWPHWVDTRNVAFNLGEPDWNNVLMTPEDVTRHNPPAGNKLYVINKDDRDAVQSLKQRFPQGQLHLQPSATPGQEFLVYFVPSAP